MLNVRNTIVLVIALVTTTAGATLMKGGFFLGAPEGTPIPFEVISLPPVDGIPIPAPSAPPAKNDLCLAWVPTMSDLVNETRVIDSEPQMRDVWERLFAEPFDPSLFDFSASAVVLIGAGLLPFGASFDVSAVESVVADYADPFLGGNTEEFLSITTTLVLPGVAPPPGSVSSYHVAAVAIDYADLDDIVLHRTLIPLP